ncbi:MAG: Asparagine--tRNA ligase [Chlamydiae bacterium]|nr:Asparagine--tRNA ligase [Chlamydiota bacterium]
MRVKITDIKNINQSVLVQGWIKSVRAQKNFAFVELNDGSQLKNLQIVIDATLPNYEDLILSLSVGAAIEAQGMLVENPNKKGIEMQATSITILGTCPKDTYPLQKKRHSFEFLREIAHLRPRSNTFGAVFRIRNALSFATHEFFQKRGFLYINTPIITASDAEGTGEIFSVSTKDDKPFFGKPTFLTVSGQLNAEAFACALSDVYTFGPTFRAEYSTTTRHVAEFWMIEPEMAFADLEVNQNVAEKYLHAMIETILNTCQEDLEFLDRFVENGLIHRLEEAQKPFERITYTKAIELLNKSGQNFEFPTTWGCDLQTEHEKYLCELFKRPVIVTDYPKEIKAFYMRENDDGKTVGAMDILVPKIGELVGGSQREERLDILTQKIQALNLDLEEYQWYLDLRRFGSCEHSGFGVGFGRLVQFITGMENIRDTIPFPRYPNHATF